MDIIYRQIESGHPATIGKALLYKKKVGKKTIYCIQFIARNVDIQEHEKKEDFYTAVSQLIQKEGEQVVEKDIREGSKAKGHRRVKGNIRQTLWK